MKCEIVRVKGNMEYILRARDRGASVHLFTHSKSNIPLAKINHSMESFYDVYLRQ